MTKAERDARPRRSKYWNTLRCDGCSKHCQYRTFRPLSGDLTLGKKRLHRPPRSKTRAFGEMRRALQRRQARRAAVLGKMHEEKLKLWNELTSSCPEREDGYQAADQEASA